VQLVEPTLDACFVAEAPARLIGDRAYDSDRLDERLRRKRAIELIAPHRREPSKTQDGRPLRRYKRRWKAERLVAWLHDFRRLVVRYECRADNFLGMLHLACIVILLRHCL
jgi:transposase